MTQHNLPNQSPGKILIADDDHLNKEIIKTYLKNYSAEIFTASDGEEAIRLAGQIPGLDLILMDISMPLINGLIACSEIKKAHPDITIIIDTAFSSNEDFARIKASGCDDHIIKPYTKENFLNLIRKHLDINALEDN